jgi:hypothetical protein
MVWRHNAAKHCDEVAERPEAHGEAGVSHGRPLTKAGVGVREADIGQEAVRRSALDHFLAFTTVTAGASRASGLGYRVDSCVSKTTMSASPSPRAARIDRPSDDQDTRRAMKVARSPNSVI